MAASRHRQKDCEDAWFPIWSRSLWIIDDGRFIVPEKAPGNVDDGFGDQDAEDFTANQQAYAQAGAGDL